MFLQSVRVVGGVVIVLRLELERSLRFCCGVLYVHVGLWWGF